MVVCAHLGRPKGKPAEEFSLAPVAQRLAEVLGRPVAFATDTVGESAQAAVEELGDGDVALLENLRFDAGETSKDDAERGEFADQLAALAEVYVGDGFGAVHRKHASVYDVPQRLPHAAGDLVRRRDRGAAQAHRRPRAARTSSCSAARRCRTSSASSTTCSTRSTGC